MRFSDDSSYNIVLKPVSAKPVILLKRSMLLSVVLYPKKQYGVAQ